jgi:hypothetical protein
MTRVGRVALAAVLIASAFVTARLADPMQAYACSCRVTGAEDVAEAGGQPGMVVFIGTVQSLARGVDQFGHARGELLVEWVFKGPLPARMPVVSGGGGDCTMPLEAGQRMITVAPLSEGVITPGLCLPFGDPNTAEGQQLIQQATAVFGPGAPPGAADPTSEPVDASLPQGFDPVQLGIVILTPFVAIVLILLVVAAFRRREDRTEAP